MASTNWDTYRKRRRPPAWDPPKLLLVIVGVGFYGRVRRLQIKNSYAQNNQEHAMGDCSQFVTTRRIVPCSGRRVGAARPRGSSPPRPISLEQPVIQSQYKFAGAAQVHRL